MDVIIQTLAGISVFMIPVIVMAVRIEHRLTKIETDISWLKQRMEYMLNSESANT